MRGGWRYVVETVRPGWRSEPIDMGPVLAGPPNFRLRFLLDTAEDVELYASELGLTREVIHRQ